MRLRIAAFVLALLLPATGWAQIAPGMTLFRPLTQSQVLAYTNASVAMTNATIRAVQRLVCTTACFFTHTASGATALLANTTTGIYLPANVPELFIIPIGSTIRVIRDSSDGRLILTDMDR